MIEDWHYYGAKNRSATTEIERATAGAK